jgi:hypothetical protein
LSHLASNHQLVNDPETDFRQLRFLAVGLA